MTATEWDQYWAAADAAGRIAVRPHTVRAHTRARPVKRPAAAPVDVPMPTFRELVRIFLHLKPR